MHQPSAERLAVGRVIELEAAVSEVEQRLAALSDALRERDPSAVAHHADHLHRALSAAVQMFTHAARHGGVPDALRLRLAKASAQVARQRELLARATAALDRAIDLLMPGNAGVGKVYNAAGHAEPLLRRGSVNA